MKRSIDWLALIVGVTFMTLSLFFLADQADWLKLDLTFIGPLLLIAFGIGSVANGIRKSKEPHDR
jgi:hypothetical protein